GRLLGVLGPLNEQPLPDGRRPRALVRVGGDDADDREPPTPGPARSYGRERVQTSSPVEPVSVPSGRRVNWKRRFGTVCPVPTRWGVDPPLPFQTFPEAPPVSVAIACPPPQLVAKLSRKNSAPPSPKVSCSRL